MEPPWWAGKNLLPIWRREFHPKPISGTDSEVEQRNFAGRETATIAGRRSLSDVLTIARSLARPGVCSPRYYPASGGAHYSGFQHE